jgi:hypothetical protein
LLISEIFDIFVKNLSKMKNSKQLFLFFLLLVSFSSVAQTYEVRRIDNQQRGRNYGTTIPTTDVAQYVGGIQSQMQAKYDSNYLRVEDKVVDIGRIVARLNKSGAISTNSRSGYITSYTDNLSKINKVNFTDNVAVSKVMSYLRAIEDELLTW